MKKRHLLKTMLLLFALIVGSSSVWADDVTGTITFGSAAGSTSVNAASVTGDDSQNNTWTVTTVGTTSFTQNPSYSQIGSSSKPATSITFTTTLSNDVTITAFSAKFGGFNGTAGTVTLKVGETTVGTGSLNATNDVTVSSTSSVTGKVLTVTVTGISKGVKAYNISYTYSENVNPNLQDADLSYATTEFTIDEDETFTAPTLVNPHSLTVTYTSTNTDVATVNESTGAVTVVGVGTTTIMAKSDATDEYKAGEASYTLTVNKVVKTEVKVTADQDYNESFAGDFGNFVFDGTQADGIDVWTLNDEYAKATSYVNRNNNDADSWLTSPKIDLTEVVSAKLTFSQCINKYFGTIANEAMVKIKKVDDENWTKLDITYPSLSGTWSSFEEQEIDLSDYAGSKIQIAFHYIGTTTTAGTWEIKDFNVTGSNTKIKKDANLSFDETAVTVIQDDEDFTGFELNNPNNLAPIVWTSTDEDVAIVENGIVVIGSKIGTTTITASFAGNDDYEAGEASYTITVEDKNKKGTKLNPYTVAEVIDGTATGNGIYVLGYIVGEFVGSSSYPRTSGFTTDANIAIADEFTTSPLASTSIPVALPTNALKTAWGNKTTGGTMGYQVLIKGNKDTYFSVNGIKNTTEVVATQKVVSISDAKYATFSSAYPFDFSESGITVYTAKAKGTRVSLTEVEDGIVPANTGVVLYAESPVTKDVPVTTTNKTALEDNEMVANVVRANVAQAGEGGKTNYILSNEDDGVGFYLATVAGAYLPANRAYLSTTATATGNAPFLGFDGNETTGINSVERGALSVEGCYTLDGRRVAQPTKGLYIVNGRKVIIK